MAFVAFAGLGGAVGVAVVGVGLELAGPVAAAAFVVLVVVAELVVFVAPAGLADEAALAVAVALVAAVPVEAADWFELGLSAQG